MKRFLCPLAAAALTCQVLRAQATSSSVLDEAGSGVETISVFSLVPPSGFAPVNVRVTNHAAAERSVTLTATSTAGAQQLESRFSLAAPAGKTTERLFMIPVCAGVTMTSRGGEASLTVRVQPAGGPDEHSFATGGSATRPFTAFSRALAAKSISDLNNAAAAAESSTAGTGPRFGGTSPPFAALYDAAMLPADWRGCSGLDVLAITADEWTALEPGVRTAVVQWVKLGGVLDLYRKQGTSAEPALPGIPPGTGRGRVHEVPWNGRELEASEVQRYDRAFAGSRRDELENSLRLPEDGAGGAGNETPLLRALGKKEFAAWQVGIILLLFGILVGPVNLFYLAKAGQRYRLFYTTPVISLAASALLLAVIFFHDGTGGKGHRAAVVYLEAAEHAAYVHQVQVSRTGVLFGGSFTMEEPAAVSMALLPDSRWTRLKPVNNSTGSRRAFQAQPQRYQAADHSLAGDWFQSRSEQAHIIDTIQSTRGRIELQPGSSPVITSTFAAPLGRVFCLDHDGKYWSSPGWVPPGTAVTLTASSAGEFGAWQAGALAVLPVSLRAEFPGEGRRGFFYASSTDPRAGIVETLTSIDWESSHVFLHGPLTTP